jgi:flagellar protein FlbT
MYIDEENLATHQQTYWKLVRELLDVVPRLAGHIDRMNEHILGGNYYRALKLAGELINYEQEILKYVQTDADASPQIL